VKFESICFTKVIRSRAFLLPRELQAISKMHRDRNLVGIFFIIPCQNKK